MTKPNEELIEIIENKFQVEVDELPAHSPQEGEEADKAPTLAEYRVYVIAERTFSGTAEIEAAYASSEEFRASDDYRKLLIEAARDLIETLENEANELYELFDEQGALEESE